MRLWALLMLLAGGLCAETVAGLKWTAPEGWRNEGSRPMRAATYAVPAAGGDQDRAECVVYFFGAGQGGSVEANIERWKGQFTNAGKTAEAKVQKRTVHGLPVTTIESAGEYSGMGGPMATEKTVKAGYRLLGAIVEGPVGNVFVKFVGPVKTVEENRKKFEAMIGSFAPESSK